MPPGGVDVDEGETLEYISGNFKIFQYAKGHRYSTDDVLAAWYGTQWAPRVERAADLGSGIGSVAIVAAWRLTGARFWTVEAQEASVRLARKSIRYNGLDDRFTIVHGDLRDEGILQGTFDLVTGSPPYFPPGTALEAEHPQAIPARIEIRGDVRDYAKAAARILAPGGLFAFVFPYARRDDAQRAIEDNGMTLLRRRDVVFKEGEAALIALFAAGRADDFPDDQRTVIEPELTVRRRDGKIDREYAAVRISFGFPPGETSAAPEDPRNRG
jgi:tRNA1(Val) A37 N6-methylase TrmN6